MSKRTRHTAALGLLALAAGFLLPGSPAAASALSPLPASDYSVQSVCAAPAPGHAGCLALQLVPDTQAAREHTHPLGVARAATPQAPSPAAGDYGLRPQDLHSAYQLPTSAASAQTIALVDAYNDPTAEADLKTYDEELLLPACAGGGCFQQVNQNGESANLPFPKTKAELESARKGTAAERERAEQAEGWGVEISLDIEAAHATCESCRIVLVEAANASDANLDTAEQAAVALGATEISNSWGAPECVVVGGLRECTEDSPAFNHPGIVVTAAAGDDGYLAWDAEEAAERGFAEFPASSPQVIAVGGTRLSLEADGASKEETVWNGNGAGGSGCSVEFAAPAWQQSEPDWSSVGCEGKRAVADVSADADPYSGLAVHDSSQACRTTYEEGGVKHVAHWCTIGGTSLASPVIASVFALAGGAAGVSYPARTLYENELAMPGSLHDVLTGSNGECSKPFNPETELSSCTPAEEAASCSSKLICLAGSGYDGPSGVGTPNGIAAFEPLAKGGNGGGEESSSSEAAGTREGGHAPEAPPAGGSAGGGAPSAGTGAQASSTAGLTGSGGSTGAARPVIRLSRLTLTARAALALRHGRPKISRLGFAFTISAAARVRVTLSRRVRVRGRVRWQVVPSSITFNASAGVNRRHLAGRSSLAPGLYRLTLAPLGGIAGSLLFRVA